MLGPPSPSTFLRGTPLAIGIRTMRFDSSSRSLRSLAMRLPCWPSLPPARSTAAQDLVPGAYTPAPTGFNIVNATMVFNGGALAFDPSLPIDDATAKIGAAGFGFARTLGIAGRFASVGVGVPFVMGHLEGLVLGQPQEATRRGFGDLVVAHRDQSLRRPGHDAPGICEVSPEDGGGRQLHRRSFQSVNTIRRATSTLEPTAGPSSRKIGIQNTQGKWTFEGDFAGVFFTDNDNYVNNTLREQAPIVAFQGHRHPHDPARLLGRGRRELLEGRTRDDRRRSRAPSSRRIRGSA